MKGEIIIMIFWQSMSILNHQIDMLAYMGSNEVMQEEQVSFFTLTEALLPCSKRIEWIIDQKIKGG